MSENLNNVFNFPNGEPHMQPRVTIKDTTEVLCSKCQNNSFHEAMFLRSVSPLLTGNPKVSYIPIPCFACDICGNVNDEFVPQELKPVIVS